MQATDYDYRAARRLAAAILLAAAQDAKKGDAAARDWLSTSGALWADDLDIAHPDVVQGWAARPGRGQLRRFRRG